MAPKRKVVKRESAKPRVRFTDISFIEVKLPPKDRAPARSITKSPKPLKSRERLVGTQLLKKILTEF
jgi:hypothetical protein